jgi:hypothetical protein
MKITKTNDHSAPKVLYLFASTDDGSDLPHVRCELLTVAEAAHHFQKMLDDERLPSIPYNAETDTVEAHYLYYDDHCKLICYGFAPLAEHPKLVFMEGNLKNEGWYMEINGDAVYDNWEKDQPRPRPASRREIMEDA